MASGTKFRPPEVLPDFQRRFAVGFAEAETRLFPGASPRTPKAAPAALLVPPTLVELLASGTSSARQKSCRTSSAASRSASPRRKLDCFPGLRPEPPKLLPQLC